jgi:hypothetical protein
MKLEFDVTRKTVLKTVGIVFLMGIVGFGTFTAGVNLSFPVGEKKGYENALTDVKALLAEKGIELQWTELGNGQYTIKLLSNGQLKYSTTMEMHMTVQQYRNGELISETYHAMSVTNFGKDWVEQQLFSDVNYTDNALYISASNDETAFSAAWTALPAEITANGLGRAVGAYTSTGVGAANITKTFSISGTQSSCLYGISAGPYATWAASLIAAEQQTATARKNMIAGDSLAITVQWSHS